MGVCSRVARYIGKIRELAPEIRSHLDRVTSGAVCGKRRRKVTHTLDRPATVAFLSPEYAGWRCGGVC